MEEVLQGRHITWDWIISYRSHLIDRWTEPAFPAACKPQYLRYLDQKWLFARLSFSYLQNFFESILVGQKDTRRNLYPNDQDFIIPEMQDSELFQQNIALLDGELTAICEMLSKHSVPFWSPRYNGHMLMENSMPAVIGYLTTMLYNPNNVGTEASPFTTMIERDVGRQLCKMLGFNTSSGDKSKPLAWGHITCDASVANFESMWVARNLKFYPLSLRLATLEGQLKLLIDPRMQQRKPFEVALCTGVKKLFKEYTNWELLNLTPDTVLDIPDQLYQQYRISQTFLQNALSPYLIQTLGKDYLEKKFGLVNPAKFYVGTTKHYSWPKGGGSFQFLTDK